MIIFNILSQKSTTILILSPKYNVYKLLHAFYWLLLMCIMTSKLSTHARFKTFMHCQSLEFSLLQKAFNTVFLVEYYLIRQNNVFPIFNLKNL